MDSQELAGKCVPHAILPLSAAEDTDGLNHLAWAVGSDARQVMEAHGHVVIAKRLFEGTALYSSLFRHDKMGSWTTSNL